MKVTQEYIYSQLLEIFLVTLKIFISNFIEYDKKLWPIICMLKLSLKFSLWSSECPIFIKALST